MGPLILATGRDKARMRQTRNELIDMMLNDKEEARRLCQTEHYPSPYELADVIDAMIEEESKWPMYRNELYQVQVRDPAELFSETWPAMVWLSIRRLDREAIHDWRHFQEIKNQLVGPENEGMEMYPSESRLTDSANQYHVFVFKDPAIKFPFGFIERKVDGTSWSTTKQRPL